ncbi:hypothetical protein PanWU01x14_199280 [Parasponia andersonii]|uniref:Uncharacterized protein n=1 Tax=Parasponia andersonii TaxID=3476 RepID=A0A2P5BYT7_PARAD|nr:hypothetical protein PanWU01x14_199280 [Parasponia andersonii]
MQRYEIKKKPCAAVVGRDERNNMVVRLTSKHFPAIARRWKLNFAVWSMRATVMLGLWLDAGDSLDRFQGKAVVNAMASNCKAMAWSLFHVFYSYFELWSQGQFSTVWVLKGLNIGAHSLAA